MNTSRAKALLFSGRPWVECHYCGCRIIQATATLDHVIPRKHRGFNGLRNMVLACERCNREKSSLSYTKYVKRMKALRVA